MRIADAEGRPILLKLTEGQAHDGRSAADMRETVETGHILLADRAYDNDALRTTMAERGVWANRRTMPNRVKTFPFSEWVYRQRNAVETFFNKLKHFRAVATRYDERNDNFLESAQLTSIRIWLRSYGSVAESVFSSVKNATFRSTGSGIAITHPSILLDRLSACVGGNVDQEN